MKKSFFRGKRGVSLTGYALLVGLISVVAITSISLVGESVRDMFGVTANKMGDVSGGGSGGGGETASVNTAPHLIAGNLINAGIGGQIGQDVTLDVLALFTDDEGNTPLAATLAANADGICVTGVSFNAGTVTLNTADATCTGNFDIVVADSLGENTAFTSISVDVTRSNTAPHLSASNVIDAGVGVGAGLDVTPDVLALFVDDEGDTPLAVSSASNDDGICVTGVLFIAGPNSVAIDTVNATCTGSFDVVVNDVLGASSATVSISVTKTRFNSAPTLISGNFFDPGGGNHNNLNVTAQVLALFQDAEGDTPFVTVFAGSEDGGCVTDAFRSGNNILVDTANSDCTGSFSVRIADSLGEQSAVTVISMDVDSVIVPTSCSLVATNSIYSTVGDITVLANTTVSRAACVALCEAGGFQHCSRFTLGAHATGTGFCQGENAGTHVCTGFGCGCGTGTCYDARYDCS